MLKYTQLKQLIKPLFLLFSCEREEYVFAQCCDDFCCDSFFPLQDLSVGHTYVIAVWRGHIPLPQQLLYIFSLSFSVFSGPITTKRSQTPYCPQLYCCIRRDTNQRSWHLSEHNTLLSPEECF